MTETDLNSLVRDHVARSEPPFLLQPEGAIARGRRTVRRRRALGAGAAALAIAVVAVVPQLVGNDAHSGDRTGIDPATQKALDNYDAQQMPSKLDAEVRGAVGPALTGLGSPSFHAFDSTMSTPLPRKYWDKASFMTTTYSSAERQVDVRLGHSGSEAEGNARQECASGLTEGLYFTCSVDEDDQGNTVMTSVSAELPLPHRSNVNEGPATWAALTRQDLRDGTTPQWLQDKPENKPARLDTNDVWFNRVVKVVHSKTFVTTASERVHASSLGEATADWRISAGDLAAIASDPVLVMPQPPTSPDGCAWTMPGSNIRCGVAVPATIAPE